MKITKAAELLAKHFGNSEAPTGRHFLIKVESISIEDRRLAEQLEVFLNVRYNQLYKKIKK